MFDPGTLVLAGGSLLSGMMSSSASSDAANAGLAANRLAQQQQKEMFDTQRADLAPWRSTGQQALGRLNELYGFSGEAPSRSDFTTTTSVPTTTTSVSNRLATGRYNPVTGQFIGRHNPYRDRDAEKRDRLLVLKHIRAQKLLGQQPTQTTQTTFDQAGYDKAMADYKAAQAAYDPAQAANNLMQMDPGYQFRLGEGKKALQNSLLARGGALSGSALKAGQRYAQNVASQEFGNAYNRLAGLANMGAGAAGQQAGFAGRYGENLGNLAISSGNIAAQGAIGQGNAWQNAINQGVSLYGLKNGWGN